MRTHMADIDANIPQYQAIVRSLRLVLVLLALLNYGADHN